MSWACKLCGGSEVEDFRTKSDHILYHRCLSCSYVSRDKSHQLSAEYEKKRYELHNNSPENHGYVKWINDFLNFAIDTQVPENAHILDFGSGPEPVMARMMEERGYQVFTEDLYFAAGEPRGPFQLITALEVFEHLHNPYEVLLNLASRLSPGGRLCISTEFLPSDHNRFEYWRYRSDETHIGLFTVKGLTAAALRAGFLEDNCDGIRYIAFRLAHRGTSC